MGLRAPRRCSNSRGLDVAHIIILAGGASKRMGRPKGLLPFFGQPWILKQINSYKSLGFKEKPILVLGYQKDLYLKNLPDLKDLCKIVINPYPEKGSFHSLKLGCRSLKEKSFRSTIILPIDVPLTDLTQVIATHQEKNAYVTQPSYLGKSGHPVIASPSLVTTILSKRDSDNLRDCIREIPPDNRIKVPVDDKRVLENLNTPKLWNAFVKEHSRELSTS